MLNIKCFLKGHKLTWNRNIFGDEIRGRGDKRTEFRCDRCGHYEYIHDFVIPTARRQLMEDVDPLVMGRTTTNDGPWIVLIFAIFAALVLFILYVSGFRL